MGCPNASLILKVDDDALVHPVRLTKLNNTIHKALATGNPDVYLGMLLISFIVLKPCRGNGSESRYLFIYLLE